MPPPPPTPPPSLPPTSRRTSVAGTYNYNKTLSEVQRLVKDTLRTTQGTHGTKKPQRGDQLQNRSERIAEMVATAVGQAVVKTVNTFSENQSEEIRRLEAENDRLIAVIRSSSEKSKPPSQVSANVGFDDTANHLVGPNGIALLTESRSNVYPLQRTFAGAIQHSLSGDVEPLCTLMYNIVKETRKLKKENDFLRKLTHQLSEESEKRFGIYSEQIKFLKQILKDNGIMYASPSKQKAKKRADEEYKTTGERVSNGESHSSPRPVRAAPPPKNNMGLEVSPKTADVSSLLEEALDFAANESQNNGNALMNKGNTPSSPSKGRKHHTASVNPGNISPRNMAKHRAKQAQQYMLGQKRKKALLKHKSSKNLVLENRSSYVDATPRLLGRLGLTTGIAQTSRTNAGKSDDGLRADAESKALGHPEQRQYLRKTKSDHMINSATAKLLLNKDCVPSSTMLNDPYFRDKPEMVDILLDNNIRNRTTLPMWNSTLDQTQEDEKILNSYLKSQGARAPVPPPPPPPSDPQPDDSPQKRSPKKTIVELTTSFVDDNELDPYDRYLLKKKQRQDSAMGADSSAKSGTKLSYAQKHRVVGNSPFKQKPANTAIRRNTTISPQKKIQLLKKSRTMYSEHSIQFAKQKVEEQKKKRSSINSTAAEISWL